MQNMLWDKHEKNKKDRALNVRKHIKKENIMKWQQKNEKKTWNEKHNNKNNIEKKSWTKWQQKNEKNEENKTQNWEKEYCKRNLDGLTLEEREEQRKWNIDRQRAYRERKLKKLEEARNQFSKQRVDDMAQFQEVPITSMIPNTYR